MITVETARETITTALAPVGRDVVPYEQALDRILAEDLLALRTQPPFAASAMDGYAVRACDLGDTPVSLRLSGESAAGHSHEGCVAPGCAIRISTGAPMPAGADQVVIQERTERDGDSIRLDDTSRPGSNVRQAGVDYVEGDRILPTGQVLTPDAIGLAVGAGHVCFPVRRQPRIGLLSTGDELVEPGEATGPDQIINSVSKALDGHIRRWGGVPVYLGIARDSAKDVSENLANTTGLDLAVTIGGASVGDHDHLRRVFADEGGQLLFEKIAVKPGKPTWFGRLRNVPFLGLPGNPVSALVMARLMLQPAVNALQGRPAENGLTTAVLAVDLPANGAREVYTRAERDARTGQVQPLRNQDSSALSALVSSDALIRRPIDDPARNSGETVDILPL